MEVGDMSPKTLQGRLNKAIKQLDIWVKENTELVQEKYKLAWTLESLQGQFEVVKANLET